MFMVDTRKAIDYEKSAREARLNRDLGGAANRWEKAGDEWVRLAVAHGRKAGIRNFLGYAVTDYESAIKLAEKYKINLGKGVYHKMGSVSKKLGDLTGEAPKSLTKRVGLAYLSIISLIAALFFVSVNLTGNAISNMSGNDTKLVGLCLFLFGLFFAFLHFRRKKF